MKKITLKRLFISNTNYIIMSIYGNILNTNNNSSHTVIQQ